VGIGIILLIVHVCLSLGIITLVLLQQGKGASEGATFGGGATSVFGASGSSNFLSKTTAVLAAGFFINCLALAYIAANRDAPTSVIDKVEQQIQQQQKAPPKQETPLFNGKDENVPQPAESPARTKPASTSTPPATKK
jgi:preprotein translocase subunit SecG